MSEAPPVDWFREALLRQEKLANLREWHLMIIEDAETLEEAKDFARRALAKEHCPGDACVLRHGEDR